MKWLLGRKREVIKNNNPSILYLPRWKLLYACYNAVEYLPKMYSPRRKLRCFGVFFTAFTTFLSLTIVEFLGQPILCLVVSTPVITFFFRTFQLVVLSVLNGCVTSLIDFPSFLSWTSLFFLLNNKCSLYRQNKYIKPMSRIKGY